MANRETLQEGAQQFDRNEIAKDYADNFGIVQLKGENADTFRIRVSAELRRQGSIIGAHEAFTGKRWDAEDQGAIGPMSGIFGALAQAMEDKQFSPQNPERQIGDDIAAGVVARAGVDPTKDALREIFNSLGVEAGMDFVTGMLGKDKPKK